MSAIPTGLILEAVNRGEATLPALKQATGFDYPVLLTALEGALSMAVRREETATGALRFYPLGSETAPQVTRIPVAPLCVTCRLECKKTHQAGASFMGGEARWMCPQCKEKFPGTHVKAGKEGQKAMDEATEARNRLDEIISKGQPCGCGKPRDHKGICAKRTDTVEAKNGRHTKKMGRPVVPIDLQQLEDALANPELTIAEIGAQFGVDRNTIYFRKDNEFEFKLAYDRGMSRREDAIAGKLGTGEDAQVEAGLAEVEVLAPPVEEEASPAGDTKLDLKLEETARAIVDEDQQRLRIQAEETVEARKAFKPSEERPIIPILTPPSPTLEEAREMQWAGVRYATEMTGEIPPSVVLKRIVWDDDFFMGAYETLIAILDNGMSDAEKEAVWLLLRYLKRVEHDDLFNKFYGGMDKSLREGAED